MNIYPGSAIIDCIDEIESGGFTKAQAETIAKATAKMQYRTIEIQQLADKNDIALCKHDIAICKQDLLVAIAQLENRLLLKVGGMIGVAIAVIAFIKG